MADVGDFILGHQKYEQILASKMGWDYVVSQSKGSSYDYRAADGSKIEVKFDWDSIKTGNHYLEYGQTSIGEGGEIPSGFALSAEDADYWVVVNEDLLRMFAINTLKRFVKENRASFRTTRTRVGVNHNREGQFSLGYLLPFELLDKHCLLRKKSPVARVSDSGDE